MRLFHYSNFISAAKEFSGKKFFANAETLSVRRKPSARQNAEDLGEMRLTGSGKRDESKYQSEVFVKGGAVRAGVDCILDKYLKPFPNSRGLVSIGLV